MKSLIKISIAFLLCIGIKMGDLCEAQTGITTEASYRTDIFLEKYKQWNIYSLDAGKIDSNYTALLRYNALRD